MLLLCVATSAAAAGGSLLHRRPSELIGFTEAATRQSGSEGDAYHPFAGEAGILRCDSRAAKLSFARMASHSNGNSTGRPPVPDCIGWKWNLARDLGCAVKTTTSDLLYINTAPLRINTRSALWLGAILTVGGTLYAYDQEIYDVLKRNQDSKLYKPIHEAGQFCEPLGYMGFTNKYIFGALVFGYLVKYQPVVNVSYDLLASFLISTPGKNLGNIVAGRRGPMLGQGARSFKFNDGRSFPSGHSVAITQLANVLSHHVNRKAFTVAVYLMAATVLLNRITSDHHWPSDVYFGAIHGWLVSRELLKLRVGRRIELLPASPTQPGEIRFEIKVTP